MQPLDPAKPAGELTGSRVFRPTTLTHHRSIISESVRQDESNLVKKHDVRALCELPFIHFKLITKVAIASLAFAWIALLVWPRTYESEAKLVLRVGRESVSLDPTATTTQTLMLQKTQEEEINSALEVLNSRSVATTVVDVLGDGPILEGALPQDGQGKSSWLSSNIQAFKKFASEAAFVTLNTAGIKDDISDRELAIREVMGNVSIFAPKKSNVITVHAESKTPEMAQAIVKEVTNSFLERHLETSRTVGSKEFFAQQSEDALEQLEALVETRSRFMQDNQIVSVEANKSMIKDQLAAIDRDLILSVGNLDQAQAQIDDIKEKLRWTADEIIAAKQEGSDTTWSGMRQRIYELELLERQYASKYTPEHRLLTQVREQLAGAREILDKLQSERVDSNTTPNPAKRRLEEELQKQETLAVGLESIISKKRAQAESLQSEANALLEYERKLSHMDREISLLDTSLHVLREKLEEARVIDELQSKRISNVSIFQPATFVERAVSPEKKILVAGFLMLGLMGGVGLAFFREMSRNTLRSVADIQQQLDATSVSEIPYDPRLVLDSTQTRSIARKLATDILLLDRDNSAGQGKTIGVVGLHGGCGATTVASNIAIAASKECGLRSLLVDADVQRRQVAKLFDLNGAPGVMQLAQGEAPIQDCITLHPTVPEMALISVSQNNRTFDGGAIDSSSVMHGLSSLAHHFDLVVVDLPPADQPDQILSIATQLDCVLLVVESEKSLSKDAVRLHRMLQDSSTRVLGVVLNKTKSYWPRWLGRSFSAAS